MHPTSHTHLPIPRWACGSAAGFPVTSPATGTHNMVQNIYRMKGEGKEQISEWRQLSLLPTSTLVTLAQILTAPAIFI